MPYFFYGPAPEPVLPCPGMHNQTTAKERTMNRNTTRMLILVLLPALAGTASASVYLEATYQARITAVHGPVTTDRYRSTCTVTLQLVKWIKSGGFSSDWGKGLDGQTITVQLRADFRERIAALKPGMTVQVRKAHASGFASHRRMYCNTWWQLD